MRGASERTHFKDCDAARTATGEDELPFLSRGGAPLAAEEKKRNEFERKS